MKLLQLRVVVGLLMAVFVVAVAASTLAVALPIALSTINDNADTAVARLGRATANSADDIFAHPEQQMAALADAPRRRTDGGSLPSEHPAFTVNKGSPALELYGQQLLDLEVEGRFQYLSLYTLFLDGSTAFCQATTPPAAACAQVWPNGTSQAPLSVTGYDTPSGRVNASLTARFEQGGLLRGLRDLRYSRTALLMRVFEQQAQRKPGSVVGWPGKSFVIIDKEPLFTLAAISRIANATAHIGYAFGVLEVRAISAVLTAGLLTPNSHSMLVDANGYVFAASAGIVALEVNPSYNTTGLPNCLKSDEWSHEVAVACQLSVGNVNDATIRDVARSDPSIFASPPTEGRVAHTQGAFVYAQALATLPGTERLSFAMVVPEANVMGDADKILPVCLGVTAGIVLIATALSLVLLTVVLQPLRTVAEKMLMAARFERDDEAVNVSVFAEVGDLQRAFVEMHDELSRIRAFVPQSLLLVESSTDVDTDCDTIDHHADHDDDGSLTSLSADTRLNVDTIADTPESRPPVVPTHRAPPIAITTVHDAARTPGRRLTTISERHGSTHRVTHLMTASSVGSIAPPARVAKLPSISLLGSLRALSSEKVSVLFVNLRGFHEATASRLAPELVAATVDAVLSAAKNERGVVDSFHGDRFLVSFNASRYASGHSSRAALTAARIAKAAGQHFGLKVTCGVATGVAQVGNLGSDSLKRFSVVGAVVPQAACLERLCKLYGVSCLVPQRLFDDLHTAVSLKTVDFVQLPGAKAPCLIASVGEELRHAGDAEWMYQLEESHAPSENCRLNSAWKLFADGEMRKSTWSELAEKFSSAHKEDEWADLAAAVSRSRSDGTSEQECGAPTPLPRALGEFYTDCVC